ncbi:MAG: hypothetical protein WCH39_05385 [Schlesneria sp.]
MHVGLGFVGLALFWLIIAVPKGGKWHVRFGKAFAVVTWVVGGSALFSSAWALVHLESFAPHIQHASDSMWQREVYQFIFAILLYLSAATIPGAVFGIQVMRKRDRHDELRQTSLPIWLSITMLSALGLLAFGLWRLFTQLAIEAGMPREAYLVPAVVGGFGIITVWREWRYVFGPSPGNRNWLRRHVWHMCGTGVAFHTAFIVFGANRLFGFQLPGAWQLIPWIAPPVIGMTLTGRYLRRLKTGSGSPSTENRLNS